MAVPLDHSHTAFELNRHFTEIVSVNLYAGSLHIQQDGKERPLHMLVKTQSPAKPQAWFQRFPKP